MRDPSSIESFKAKTDKRSLWIIDKQQRLGTTKACVAVANKNAHFLALVAHEQSTSEPHNRTAAITEELTNAPYGFGWYGGSQTLFRRLISAAVRDQVPAVRAHCSVRVLALARAAKLSKRAGMKVDSLPRQLIESGAST